MSKAWEEYAFGPLEEEQEMTHPKETISELVEMLEWSADHQHSKGSDWIALDLTDTRRVCEALVAYREFIEDTAEGRCCNGEHEDVYCHLLAESLLARIDAGKAVGE